MKGLFEEAGLAVGVDPIGNTFARWDETRPGLPAVATGSHIDAIPNAGKYDGTAGVVGMIEAIRAGFRPARSIELILFTGDEPTRFDVGCLRSRAMAGALDPGALASLSDAEGLTLDEVRQAAGVEGTLEGVKIAPGRYAAFVELNMEQGPIREREGLPIGVVEAIAAPASLRVDLDGKGGHAGTVLMPERRDAIRGAAEIVLLVEAAARQSGSADSVATVGVCGVEPGTVNGIPTRAPLEIEDRDIDPEPRDRGVVPGRGSSASTDGQPRL